MLTNFVRHACCDHSGRTDHGPDPGRRRPLCIDCYHPEEDSIYERYSTIIYEAQESDLAAMTVAFEAEAERPVKGSMVGKIQTIMIIGSIAVFTNVAFVERVRENEVARLWKKKWLRYTGLLKGPYIVISDCQLQSRDANRVHSLLNQKT
jgi:hypothetical protein